MTGQLDAELGLLELFAGVDAESLRRVAAAMSARSVPAGQQLVREGEPGSSFFVVLDGTVTVTRLGDDGEVRSLGAFGPGSILGEMSMLTHRVRRASVTAVDDARVAEGDEAAFAALLEVTPVHDRITAITARRLAENVLPVHTRLRDGAAVELRPLVPADRGDFEEALNHLSAESLRRRFFTPGRPSARVIDHLVNINYVDHFAWRVATDPGGTALATGRYVRRHADPKRAEVAFGVVDEFHGRGLGTLLLGALAVAAQPAGIEIFEAEVLADNSPMLAVFTKVGAEVSRSEPGVLAVQIERATAEQLIDDVLRAKIRRAAREVVTAAGLALAKSTGG